MKVTPKTSNEAAALRPQTANENKKANQSESKAVAAQKGPADGAVASISVKAKEMGNIKEAALKAPDVREEKIAELRKRIAEGRYSVAPKDVADKMVDEHLSEAGIK